MSQKVEETFNTINTHRGVLGVIIVKNKDIYESAAWDHDCIRQRVMMIVLQNRQQIAAKVGYWEHDNKIALKFKENIWIDWLITT